ncbi:Hint domain-containing protein [Marivita hallyeonensis]|uniref:Hint domain-containing protein n=1 Tax=Marivita hallyeonensis TaxID=996342 RepID=A0A1M5US71_9RHOB|nr:Hint domain-containing protein [Marivita hallyeonensis]SHH65795.1 Hint domain-containing protein [Marivita hallyeonensis]
MSWFALLDGRAHDSWLREDVEDILSSRPRACVPKGSILLETHLSPDARPQTLLSFRRGGTSTATLSLMSTPHGSVVLVMARDNDVVHEVVERGREARTDTLQVTISWDLARGMGRFVVARPESEHIIIRHFAMTNAPLLTDLCAIARPQGLTEVDPDVVFVALSTEIEPVGPMPTLSPSVPVETAQGLKMATQLRQGDVVRAASGALVPVLNVVRRTVPSLGSFRPVRVRAPYFGLTQDVVVSLHQRLLVSGPEVEYLFGRENVLIPASTLVNGYAGHVEPAPRFVTYHQLLLPHHDAVRIPDAALETLYLGRMRRDKIRLGASLLADIPRNLLPEHHRAGYQVLRAFEAISLAEARAA